MKISQYLNISMKMLSMKVNLNNILIIRSGNMYVAVCDAFRHVYIYRQPGCPSTGVQMVHRPSGRKVVNVARSQVLSIDDTEECLGALATDAFVIILTASSLIAIRVNDD